MFKPSLLNLLQKMKTEKRDVCAPKEDEKVSPLEKFFKLEINGNDFETALPMPWRRPYEKQMALQDSGEDSEANHAIPEEKADEKYDGIFRLFFHCCLN